MFNGLANDWTLVGLLFKASNDSKEGRLEKDVREEEKRVQKTRWNCTDLVHSLNNLFLHGCREF